MGFPPLGVGSPTISQALWELCAAANGASKRTREKLDVRRVGRKLLEQIRVALAVSGVAAACRRFESRAVEHREITPRVFDQAMLLQRTGRRSDADTPHAQHVGKELMGHPETVGMRSVLAHEQPAREPWTDLMEAKACRRGLQKRDPVEGMLSEG